MVAKDTNGNNVKVPGLIADNEIEVKRFLKALKRIETKIARQKEFDRKDFSHVNYLEDLKNYRVRIEI